MQASATTYKHTNPTVFHGGTAVADYYGADNDNYVAGEGFCCGDNDIKTKSISDDSPNYEKLQYYYHSDHLGSASYITNLDGEVVQHIEYAPFGEVFLEERNNTWNTPFLFNGKELDEETGLYYYGARYYNPRISLWYGVDPLNEERYGLSPYQYCQNNPVMLVDPTGMLDDEFDKDGNKVSNLGGDNVDFHHQKNGDTKVVDRETGESNIIKRGESFIRDYEHRNDDTNWKTIYDEWKTGTGPENSLIYGKDHQMNDDMFFSYQVNRATEDFNDAGGDGKIYFPGNFGLFGYMRSSTNMTEQMVGKAGVSVYSVGDKAVIMIVDSKSISSWTWKWRDGDNANVSRVNGVGGPKSTTNQTYLFIVTKKELQSNFKKYNSWHDTDW